MQVHKCIEFFWNKALIVPLEIFRGAPSRPHITSRMRQESTVPAPSWTPCRIRGAVDGAVGADCSCMIDLVEIKDAVEPVLIPRPTVPQGWEAVGQRNREIM